MIIKTILSNATQELTTNGSPSARLDAELILAKLLNKTREWLLAHDDEKLTTKQQIQSKIFIY